MPFIVFRRRRPDGTRFMWKVFAFVVAVLIAGGVADCAGWTDPADATWNPDGKSVTVVLVTRT